MPFFMIRDDISKFFRADALVNPANPQLLEGSGSSRAIYLAAGEEEMTKACQKIGFCELGKAVITPAFRLPARYVIHAVGPVWVDGKHGEEEVLYSTYTEAMLLAEKHRLESIAFPLLSSGNYGFPKDKALKVAIRAISDFLMEHELLVYLVLYDRAAVEVSKRFFTSLEEYIDNHYVDSRYECYYADKRSVSLDRMRNFPSMEKWKPEEAKKADDFLEEEFTTAMPFASPQRSLDNLLEQMGETFSQMLFRLIDERGLKDSYVYKKANVDRRHFSKIRTNIHYTPNKKTVIAFAIALELSLDETKDLLKRAGYALSNSSKFDVIICYFIEKHQYNIYEINETLFAYEQPILGG